MEHPLPHSLHALFSQLGLANSDSDITNFIEQHKPLSQSQKLHQADFWNQAQADFLQQAIADDADWADAVDHLDSLLR
jgi:hypothetical protein